MTTNDLPSWLPVFNMVAAVASLVLIIPGIFVQTYSRAYRAALIVALVILFAGALFQANILPLWAWVVLGSGGRLLVLAIVVAGTVWAWPTGHRLPPPPSPSLDDISAQLVDIKRLAGIASASAERAHEAATAADDRVITQAERAVDDRARGIRIEGVSTDTNDRAKDIQGRLP